MKTKILLLFILIFSHSVFSQSTIQGNIIDQKSRLPVMNLRISFEISGKYGGVWSGITDEKGNFKIRIPKSLPQSFKIKIQDNRYQLATNTMAAFDEGEMLMLEVFDKSIIEKNKLIAYQKELRRLKRMLANEVSRRNKTKSIANKLNNEISRLNNTISMLNNKISDQSFELDNLRDEIKELRYNITDLREQILKKDTKIINAYSRTANCHCLSYSENEITVGFNFIDINGESYSSGTFQFRMEVERLRTLRTTDKGYWEPLRNIITGHTYLIKNVTFPVNGLIEMKFKTEKGVIKQQMFNHNKYRIKIYNNDFDLPIQTLDINNLKDDCQKQKDHQPFNGRRTIVAKSIVVNNKNIQIKVYDNLIVDNDISSIYLNGKPIITNFIAGKKSETSPISIELNKGTNQLLFFSESNGTRGKNTITIEVIDKKFRKVVNLASDNSTNSVINLIVK